MNLTAFYADYYNPCNTAIGTEKPKSYDGDYYEDDKYPDKNRTGTM